MRRFLFVTAAVLFLAGRPASAQESDFREDLRFAEALRNRGDVDLSLEYLKKLALGAPPELAKELPLEFAKTGLRIAAEEPETGKRLNLYKEARENFQKFIDANPGHPRVAEANLDIARVLNLQGKTELAQSLLSDDAKTKKEQAAQARATLEQAAVKLQDAAKVLEKTMGDLPDPDTITDAKKKKEALALRNRFNDELKQTELDRGLNLYDQAATWIAVANDEQASGLLVKAKALLDPIAGGPPSHPVTWKAKAWLGRIVFETESGNAARKRFAQVIDNGTLPAAAEGYRLARYFRLHVIRAAPTDEEKKKGSNSIIIEAATRWRNDYQRFLKTPEGFGLSFLLAETYLAESHDPKAKARADYFRGEARKLLREIENNENEFTDRARRLKIRIIAEQGGFKVPIPRLRTFEDFYIRAQFEAFQRMGELKEAKDPKEAEEKSKARVENILLALRTGLALPEVKKMKTASMELNNARTMLAFWLLNSGQQLLAAEKKPEAAARLNEAIAVGEAFARNDPRSSQAEMAAVYALQAYGTLVDMKKADEEGGKVGANGDDERARLLALAQYMEERWPRSLAGEVARHTVGLTMFRDKNYPEAVKKLSLIGPGYGSFTIARYQLADAAINAAKEGVDPIAGDRAGDYQKRAMAALDSMPESALGPDPFTNQLYVAGKAIFGRDLFKYKRFQQMNDLAGGLLARLPKLRFNDDDKKDLTIRNQLQYELVDITLFGRYGLANQAFEDGDHQKVTALLDGLVDSLTKPDEEDKEGAPKTVPQQEKSNLKKNPQLATAILSLALKANIQLGKIDRTDLVLDALDKVGSDAGEGGSTNILKLLAFLIRGQVEEVKKKNDKEAVDKAIKGYTSILDKRIKKQKTLNADFIRVVADCYSSMGEHAKAAEELGKVQDTKARPGTPEDKAYRAVQLVMIRELRLSKSSASLKKARKAMDAIMGTKARPGWGQKEYMALKEQGELLEAEGKYSEAFPHWGTLVKILAKTAGNSNQAKEYYLESYYHMVASYLKSRTGKDRDKAAHLTALKMMELEHNWPDFGGGASKKRFDDLLAEEPKLKAEYENLRKKRR
jgi:tetratricopeptide (TPR) repeat protein